VHLTAQRATGDAEAWERITTMAENKTKPTRSSVTSFLNRITDRQLRADCVAILEMMQKVSHAEPVMWGSAIIGFGTYHCVYESGREGDSMLLGFSRRKQQISIYLMGD
jgi:tRNA(Ile2) C34 agmatinyltransferase TiaS